MGIQPMKDVGPSCLGSVRALNDWARMGGGEVLVWSRLGSRLGAQACLLLVRIIEDPLPPVVPPEGAAGGFGSLVMRRVWVR